MFNVSKISSMNNLSFSGIVKQNNASDKVKPLDVRFTTPESRAKTVTVLGSSKNSDTIMDAIDKCSQITKELVQKGFNIQTGCGNKGIMGAAYNAAKENSVRDIKTGKPLQNLAIIRTPAWGDEDFNNCVLIGKAKSEAERIEKFRKTSNTFVIFPGSAATLQEATSLIQLNEYAPKGEPLKKIILFGKNFFDGLFKQYKTIADANLLKHPMDQLFKIFDNKKDVIEEIEKFAKVK